MRGVPHAILTEAQRAFILRHVGAANAAARRFRNLWPPFRMDEFEDAVTDGLIRAACTYDPERSSVESSWVYQAVIYMLRERYRGLVSGRLTNESLVRSSSVAIEDTDRCSALSCDPLAERVDRLGMEQWLSDLLKTLTPYARDCLMAWANDDDLVEWAAHRGVNVKSVYQRKHAALRDLQNRVKRLGIRDPRGE